jgi:hypothetical protein
MLDISMPETGKRFKVMKRDGGTADSLVTGSA